MKHSYKVECECQRCRNERHRRELQTDGDPRPRPMVKVRKVQERKASRAEQMARLLDCGPAAWDDKDNPDY